MFNQVMWGFVGILLWVTGWIMGSITESPDIILTDNMKDCVERQGEYALNIKSDGEIYYEWCEIANTIKYSD